ncbi:Ig-like domain-containing protein [Gaetbulibacter sp. M240]|uniref:Ig-like domain-containing protein n=1 Tax=Gaetbulibacter sp. M240 TaxID=3126511 RepID=UPI00374F66C1
MKNLFFLQTLIGLLLCYTTTQAQQLVTYDNIPGRSASDHYTCRVKFVNEDDTAWRDAFVLQTRGKEVAEDPEDAYYDLIRGFTASWITFESDFNGDSVIVEIAKKDGTPITEAMVRPVADASEAVITDGKAYVTFTEPANVNVDINGQMENNYTGYGYNGPKVHTITLFGNPMFTVPDVNDPTVRVVQPSEDINTIDRTDWNTIIFAPGVHEIGMSFKIYSNEVLYIPGDAVVKGTIHPLDAWGPSASQNWKVYGSGTISGEDIARLPADQGKEFKPFTYQAEGAHLEGFVVADPAFHTFNMGHSSGNNANPNIYKNLKILAWRKNSDGINAFRASEVSDCFFRVQDDAFYFGQSDVHQHDNVVWNDTNGAVLFLQNVPDGSTCSFNNVKVIYHRAQWHWWDGGRIVSFRQTPTSSSFSNILVKNIVVEDPLPAFPPFYATMIDGTGSATMSNIIIENVHQEHDGVSSSLDATRGKPQNTMIGLDDARKWENIWFKNCYFNGKILTSFEDGNFYTEFVNPNTVIFSAIATTGVTIDNCLSSDLEIENVHQLTATITPTDATDKSVTWISSNTSVLTVNENGLLNPVSSGSTTITVTSNNGNYTDTCQVTVNDSGTLKTNEFSNLGVKVFLDPDNRYINIESETNLKNVSLYSLTGKLLIHKDLDIRTFQIDVSPYSNSLYLLSITNTKGSSNNKLIVN